MENNVNNNLNVNGNNVPQPQTFDNQTVVGGFQPPQSAVVESTVIENTGMLNVTDVEPMVQPISPEISVVERPVLETPSVISDVSTSATNVPVEPIVQSFEPLNEVSQPQLVNTDVIFENQTMVSPPQQTLTNNMNVVELQEDVNAESLANVEQPTANEHVDVQPVETEHSTMSAQSGITPSPDMAAPSEVLSPQPLDEVTSVPETFGMAAYYKPVVDFSRELAGETAPETPVQQPTPVIESPGSSNETLKPEKMKKGNNKIIFIIIGILVVIAIAIGAYFLFFNKDTKEEAPKEEPKELAWDEKRPDWDSSTSKIKVNKSATKLTCTYEEPLEEMTNKITYTHLYENDIYTQVVVEDEIQFTEGTIQYYDYYVGSGEEEVEYQTEMYDNITIEIRKKKTAVSIAYSFDLTASSENPKNMLDDKNLTKDEMRTKMENMGFVCE